ncbi:hypothetical protein BN946_scf185014.g100 [Trametes cinnabarina]|uniref:Protection of telomeres protein 1 n=1 Tax=Pycnoporus cinnabarinus TaxID=5643 RepID=A0A060SGV1_PYCCI|nr:hypothetical protein BN946_scf185014.g100 [Trametes cinnabarina]
MKRAAKFEPPAASKRARPDPQALAELFKPGQKRTAGDIYRKGTDGTGYIEGKVFERGTPAGNRWVFLLTVELGSRVQVSLSGACAEHFDKLPITVGAHVQIGTRGLVLQDLEGLKRPLLLAKRFAWTEGVTIYVQNPKTGEESLVDTWAGLPPAQNTSTEDSEDVHLAGPSMPPTETVQAPTTTENLGMNEPEIENEAASPAKDVVTGDLICANSVMSSHNSVGVCDRIAPPLTYAAMAVNRAHQGVESAAEAPAMRGQTEAAGLEDDSQNPQSLPSPPPDTGEQHAMGTDYQSHVSVPQAQSISIKVTNGLRDTASKAENQIRPIPTKANSAESARDNPSSRASNQVRTEKSKTAKNAKKLRHDRERRQKQLQKAGKLGQPQKADTPTAQSREPSAEDGEDYYWDAAETLPSEAFLDNSNPDVQPHEQPAPALNLEDEAQPERTLETVGIEEADNKAPNDLPVGANADDPWQSLRMGCVAGLVNYTPLLHLAIGPGMQTIMGIVESARPIALTKSNEFSLRLSIYDPTNYATGGLSVVLFDKLEKGLPKVEAGDILMLRSIQIKDFNGLCAIGASYKGWQWALYQVKSGKISSAPPDTCAMRYFKPEAAEVTFCIRLGDWWREVSSVATTFDTAFAHTRRVRPHKTIAEAEHDEYFDCTVEVLHGFRNDNGVHTVFVTDYTRNPNVSPTQGEWCPSHLAPFVLRIEMWDSSAEVGQTMQPGEYYSIRNLRTKISGGGYLEGKMQEGEKIARLDEDQLENQPHLAELLKRKTEWEADMNATGGVHEFPHQLIEEAEENRHFKCTVEVVYISPKDDYTYLYVTDYTSRSDLVPVAASIAPPALADRVVRVELRDTQVDTAKNLEAGDYIAIRNLRLRPSNGGALLAGRLGGDQRLITKLNRKASGNAELRALLSRKEEWLSAQAKPKREGKRTAARAARQAAAAAEEGSSMTTRRPPRSDSKAAGKQLKTLQEVKESTACPAVFRVRTRAVDFFPDDLRDCVVLRCTSCDQTLPKTRRRCTRCDDAMDDETAVRAFFELWFRVADEEGTTLDVTVADERCSVLQDLSPDDVYEDDDAFAMLVARVKPLLGDLLDVSDGEAKRRPVDQHEDGEETPWLDLTIGSWLPAGEDDTAETRAYVVLKHSLYEDA